MAKFHKIENDNEGLYIFHCPGCNYGHPVRFRGKEPVWQVFGVENDNPTVTPSILVNAHITERVSDRYGRCHSFIKNGKIQFLADCHHELAGKTVELLDFDSFD